MSTELLETWRGFK